FALFALSVRSFNGTSRLPVGSSSLTILTPSYSFRYLIAATATLLLNDHSRSLSGVRLPGVLIPCPASIAIIFVILAPAFRFQFAHVFVCLLRLFRYVIILPPRPKCD